MPNNYRIEHDGVISAGAEVLYLPLPCHIYSTAGRWSMDIDTVDDLRDCLERHSREPGVQMDVEACFQYYAESRGEILYSAAEHHLRADPRTAGLMPGFEGDY